MLTKTDHSTYNRIKNLQLAEKSTSSSPFSLSLQSGVATAYHFFSKPSCLQRPSPSHQLPPYLFSLHLKIFSLGLLVPSFLFPGNSVSHHLFFLHTLVSLHDMSHNHLKPPSHIFIPNCTILTVFLIYHFLILPFSCPFHSKPQHFHLCNFHLFHLFFSDHYRLKSIHHCWSYH